MPKNTYVWLTLEYNKVPANMAIYHLGTIYHMKNVHVLKEKNDLRLLPTDRNAREIRLISLISMQLLIFRFPTLTGCQSHLALLIDDEIIKKKFKGYINMPLIC